MRLSQMQDVVGCRIVVADIAEQGRVVEAAREELIAWVSEGERWAIDDRRTRPSHGYRALHLVRSIRNVGHVEVQVRTRLQDLWAQMSERLDRRAPGIKYGSGPERIQNVLTSLSELIAVVEQNEIEPIVDTEGRKLTVEFSPDAGGFLDRLVAALEAELQ